MTELDDSRAHMLAPIGCQALHEKLTIMATIRLRSGREGRAVEEQGNRSVLGQPAACMHTCDKTY